ncbi:MAG TPA: uroporphyrinogen-III C-methyltransferase [Anaerolineae bacterium]|nr:uroporphyrinogen-III C-methyltransferase [Anaerolineae bacterium]
MTGSVYIIGAGPGDPGLITVKGLAYLRQADVVLYDRLVHPQLLDEAPAMAERIDVGKAPTRHRRAQAEINTLLIEHARAGKIVVRLKGGDPFVFGRGGEECLALAEAGIPFEVIPGVSSAIAVPAYAGIPLTHREVARSFTVITGHTCDSQNPGFSPDDGTLVFLMGVAHLPEIVSQLIAHGRSPETPVAVIQRGTTSAQRVVEGTLADIVERAREVEPPATIVIGEVVRLRQKLDWFDPTRAEPEPIPLEWSTVSAELHAAEFTLLEMS